MPALFALLYLITVMLTPNSAVSWRSLIGTNLLRESIVEDTVTYSLPPLNRADIESLMPIAPGWLLVERVIECRPPDYIRTCRRIEAGDAFVASHIHGGPMALPGALLIEFVNQSVHLLGLMSRTGSPEVPQSRPPTRCSAQFLAPACVGELLVAEVTLDDSAKGIGLYEGIVKCGEQVVCRVRLFGAPGPYGDGRRLGAGPRVPGESQGQV